MATPRLPLALYLFTLPLASVLRPLSISRPRFTKSSLIPIGAGYTSPACLYTYLILTLTVPIVTPALFATLYPFLSAYSVV